MIGIYKILLSVFICILYLLLLNGVVTAKEPLIWMSADYPPVGIEQGPLKNQGMADLITRILVQEMLNYDHKFQRANLKRILSDLETGKNVCVPGMIITEERKKKIHFTRIPIIILTPLSFVIRKEDRNKFGASQIISLEKIIQDKGLRLGLADGISGGNELDAIIDRYRHEQHLYFARGTNLVQSLLHMIANKRLDYTVTYPWMVTYFSQETGLSDQLITLKLKESRNPIIWYAACPKNEWGAALAQEIDRVLIRIRPEKRYRKILEKWMPKEILPEYRYQYDNIFLKMK